MNAPLPQVDERLLSISAFRRLLLVQILFYSASATFLILPKHLAVTLHAGPGWIGLVMGTMAGGAIVVAPVVGPLVRRIGPRRTSMTGSLLMCVGALLFMLVTDMGALALIARGLQGIGGGLVAAVGGVLVMDLVPRRRLASGMALYMTAGLIANLATPPLAEWLLALHYGNLVFLAAGGLAAGAAIVGAGLPDLRYSATAARGRPAAAFLLVSALAGLGAGTMFTFHQPLALAHGALQVSGFLVAFTATAALLRLFGGRAIDHLGAATVARWAVFAYAGALLAMPLMGSGQLPLFGMLIGAAHGLFFPTFTALTLMGGEGREARMAWLGATDKLGYLMVIPLGQMAQQTGYSGVFLTAGGLLVVGGVILFVQVRT